jgi:cytochrome c biogenesis protein CcdA
MHNAPAVSYPVGRSHVQAALLIFLLLAGLVTRFLWVANALWDWRQTLMIVSLCLAMLFAWQEWQRTRQGMLSWDGAVWWFSGVQSSVMGSMSVQLDFQFILLLKMTPLSGPPLWLWAERKRLEPLWVPLRHAVFSRPLDALHRTGGKGSPVESVQP